ncbi:MAG: hybrid sensor histidine kinase/response regulator [Magnetococcales bacterium]|nr:hybrid sensor histidine kinase/response regulator [Magnetococcales bacterium]
MQAQADLMADAPKSTLLIIDDQPSSIFMLGQMLRKEYRVDFATGGMEGLQKAREGQPDLILLDISMPDMDGYTVCQQLKNEATTRDIPVLFISLLNDAENERIGLQLGALDYITKPFNETVITSKIKNHLNTRRQLCALTAANREMVRQAQSRERMEKFTLHDLKNHLGFIINLPGLLENLEGTTTAHMELAALAEQEGMRMLEMINQAMDLYKLESQDLTLPNDPVDLVALIHKLCQDMQTVAGLHKINLRIVGDADAHYWVRGGSRLLYSLFGNLLKNAIEASPDRHDVTIRFDPGRAIHIHNHGAVPEAIRENFFGKFVTHGKRFGSGLGAYSAAMITGLHHGEIFLCAGMEETEIVVALPPMTMPMQDAEAAENAVPQCGMG